ncbi:hypothetical protein NKG05_22105 [Oerskovia sp. M15]
MTGRGSCAPSSTPWPPTSGQRGARRGVARGAGLRASRVSPDDPVQIPADW